MSQDFFSQADGLEPEWNAQRLPVHGLLSVFSTSLLQANHPTELQHTQTTFGPGKTLDFVCFSYFNCKCMFETLVLT
jgi:hypothetical protein